jgi:hypothetical protein
VSAEALRTAKEQLIYKILPRLTHDEWCRDWLECCTAKKNAEILLDLFTTLPGNGDELVDDITVYETEYVLTEAFGDLDSEILEGPVAG